MRHYYLHDSPSPNSLLTYLTASRILSVAHHVSVESVGEGERRGGNRTPKLCFALPCLAFPRVCLFQSSYLVPSRLTWSSITPLMDLSPVHSSHHHRYTNHAPLPLPPPPSPPFAKERSFHTQTSLSPSRSRALFSLSSPFTIIPHNLLGKQ